MKLSLITAPTGYQVTHVACEGRASGGIATLVSHSMHVMATNKHEFYVHVQLTVNTGTLHVVNVYIPPKYSKPDHLVWGYLLQLLDSIPMKEPVALVGDFNAHWGSSIGAWSSSWGSTCTFTWGYLWMWAIIASNHEGT